MKFVIAVASTLALGLSAHATPIPEQENPRGASLNQHVAFARPSVDFKSLNDALAALQNVYFSHGAGIWPGVNDWVSAVLGTQLAATLKTISRTDAVSSKDDDHEREDLVNAYFSALTQTYPAQDILGIRMQANDDMLWVVLEWLSAITFVQQHSALRHRGDSTPWYGNDFIQPFAHRARAFWEAAQEGWDETQCGGGMTWDNKKLMYKNSITNELWIAGSSAMYLHFTGDNDSTPLAAESDKVGMQEEKSRLGSGKGDFLYKPHDKKYLDAAVKGYKWLMGSGMRDAKGLFIDGFHVDDAGQCTKASPQVWTYNQGVLLTGQRNLWQATGDESYLNDGHALIRTVIGATGWDLAKSSPIADRSPQGIGRAGVLEEHCDETDSCNPDQKTFKGIYFSHYNDFCQPLPRDGGSEFGHKASSKLAAKHDDQCALYAAWVKHNAEAALRTRDGDGLFGGWWAEDLAGGVAMASKFTESAASAAILNINSENGAVDESQLLIQTPSNDPMLVDIEQAFGGKNDVGFGNAFQKLAVQELDMVSRSLGTRSAEKQSGGVAVLRAAVEHQMRG